MINPALLATVALVCTELTDDELATLNLVATLDSDPRDKLGSKKYLCLFDMERGGIPQMHEMTKRAIGAVINRRFPE